MKKLLRSVILLVLPFVAPAQSDQHYTMFMYNKLLYNAAYAGSREVTSLNCVYRDQWTDMPGAPKTMGISFDAPAGNFMKAVRKVAVGFTFNSEQQGIERNTNLRTYYAYRIYLKKSVVSFGLSAGADLYSANYNALNPYQPNDPNLVHNVRNKFLPNFGSGVYLSGDRYYCGFSVPSMIENHFDKNNAPNTAYARQVRSYYFCTGRVYAISEILKLEPQLLARYAGNNEYFLPFSCDINCTAIAYDRLMAGVTYRTDKSLEFIVHMQVTKRLNAGYAYDYVLSKLNGYSGGAHELVVGYDVLRDTKKYITPRFIKVF